MQAQSAIRRSAANVLATKPGLPRSVWFYEPSRRDGDNHTQCTARYRRSPDLARREGGYCDSRYDSAGGPSLHVPTTDYSRSLVRARVVRMVVSKGALLAVADVARLADSVTKTTAVASERRPFRLGKLHSTLNYARVV